MAISSEIEKLVEVVKSLSNDDINRLAKLVRQERKRRGLKTSKSRDTDQGKEDDED